ncbi:extracellular catalytic domain type 1 short-chain-length polyhydroxyalkanoate depolymerase [Actinophytocola algeriensis]|uniref:Poly(Hydroxyalkanoate) depolymerase family esterase n=1 Tax=Actinophytocola algeriensis TaxID=1768010 RepID=A0A7W7VD92_9PSEU|nr:PHB depolymerase family esterase [Actinophytocola algeriensis]MBB4905745.1 poly(hydroxyalkanoate) depolymerase family esterase [Actinophytocola algeriensis]MBE1472570.1 poly(hydroxyalkanoate) depolymerase family esterase [Actinophytocola algeriensis]
MRKFLSRLGVALLLAAALLGVPAPAMSSGSAASLVEVTGFGTNPSNLRMHLYVPDGIGTRPAVVVAVHYCTGSGPAFHSGTEFARLADQYKFIVIYPSATRSGQCFDVYTQEALRRNGGSDPVGIRSMVSYVQQRYDPDPERIFVTGASSGAMMTNVLLGDYPDVFKAGAAFMGVPFACFATTPPNTWNSECANGRITRTPQQWGDLVRGAYPGYTGARPRMQVWHGTEDSTLRYPNFGEQVKQWTNVLGVSQTPAYTDSPRSGWTRTRYGGTGTTAPVEAVSLQGVGHNLPMSGMAAMALAFFGITGGSTEPPPTSGPCRVAYDVTAWNTGLTAAVTITNTGTAPISGWSLAFTLPGGQTITSGWGATYSPASGEVTARPLSYTTTINQSASVGIGFQATHTGNTAEPASFTLNGTPCTAG